MDNLFIKRLYKQITGSDKRFGNSVRNVQVTGQPASDLIKAKILDDKPLMVSRFGTSELNCILNYIFINENKNPFKLLSNVSKGIAFGTSWKENVVKGISFNAGLFPPTVANLERYAEMSIQDMAQIDILGSWLSEEAFVYKYFKPDHARIFLEDLSPYNHANPWSEALHNKKVLVVHPFETTIQNQYKHREFLFKDKRVLPEFELKTVRAVQSIAGTATEYKSWFDALDAMTDKIANTDFEVAILGCGAYGMPLAARIKRMDKKAIHIGGSTQTLFGIKGSRWELPQYNYQEKYYNSYWTRTLESERPANAHKIEDACYW